MNANSATTEQGIKPAKTGQTVSLVLSIRDAKSLLKFITEKHGPENKQTIVVDFPITSHNNGLMIHAHEGVAVAEGMPFNQEVA